MKNKTYVLNTILAAALCLYLLGAVLVRSFLPLVILPEANIPNLTLISLIALVLEHYLNPHAKRSYVCIIAFAALTFGLLPVAACFVSVIEAVKLGMVGALVFTVVTALFTTIQDRLSSGPAAKASAFFSAVSLYMAAQCFTAILL